MDYTWEQLREASQHVQNGFTEIRQEYRPLAPYMVFSSPYGQLPLDAHPMQVLEEFPWMVAENEVKAQAMLIQRRLVESKGDRTGKEHAQILTSLERHAERVSIRGDVNFEIRFGRLHYPLIWQLQQDPRVDRELTPQTRASIRIVVATLDSAWIQVLRWNGRY
jgi:hypothetical protein